MRESSPRLVRAFRRFDELNSEDPRRVRYRGHDEAYELAYSRRMTAQLARFCAEPGEELKLAARAQHLCRWRLPRTEFPADRKGYLAWRRRCSEMHAEVAAEVLYEVGYLEETVERVARLLKKDGLGDDPAALSDDQAAQILEDVACLVFLESVAEEFLGRREPASARRILRRTWSKMSERARDAALDLDLPDAVSCLVNELVESERLGEDRKARTR